MTLAGTLLLIELGSAESSATLALLEDAKGALRVDHVQSLSAALGRLARGGYHAVLMDPRLPDARGLEALERILATGTSTPVVLWSELKDEETATRALRMGAQDYLVKHQSDSESIARALLYAVERKRGIDEALRAGERRTSVVLDAIPDAILRIDSRGRLLDFKPSHEGRYARRGIRGGQRLEDWLPAELAGTYRRHLGAAFEHRGTEVFDYMHGDPGSVTHFEARVVASGADEVLAIVRDVTEQKHLQEQLRLSQRLEAVGRLAGGVAHDFNNILTIVQGNAELALVRPDLPVPTRKALEEISATAIRAAALTRQLLAFSRKQVMKTVPLDLNSIVLGTAKMLRHLIGENIEITVELKSEPSTIRADPAQIEQILLNLAVNARDAMSSGGELTFQTDDVDVSETYAGQEFVIASGSYVSLVITDTGVGMDAATRARAFEPFFTTKERGKGTGLGLSTVYGIVKQTGGYVWIYSEPGMGTAIKLYFPSARSDAIPPPVGQTKPATESRGETILLVEDDGQVLEVASRFLTEAGYRVIAATGIENALERVAEAEEPIHLLATDVVLPGTSGRELSDRLQAARPGLKTLFVSGYTEEAIARHGVLEPGVAFLEKPYSRAELLTAVRRTLEAGPGAPSE